jgi:hypothetical protein
MTVGKDSATDFKDYVASRIFVHSVAFLPKGTRKKTFATNCMNSADPALLRKPHMGCLRPEEDRFVQFVAVF